MFFPRTLTFSTALALVAGTAHAELSAADVWGDWRAYIEGVGYSVSATESMIGSVLEVSDIAVAINGGPDMEAITLRMGALRFVENADGTVDVALPDSLPMSLEIVPGGVDQPARFDAVLSQTGQRGTASGTPAQIVYDYAADTIAIALTGMTVEGETYDSSDATFRLSGENLRESTTVTVGQTRSYEQSYQVANMVYEMFMNPPDEPETISFKTTAETAGYVGTTNLPMPPSGSATDMNTLLASGLAVDGAFTTSGAVTEIEVTAPEGTSRIKTATGATRLEVGMSTAGVRYDVSSENVEVGAQLAELPLPLFAQMARTGFEMLMPVAKSDTPQDFALAFNMTDFTMSNVIWGLFDPEGQLPRDPATVALDLTGKARLLFDFLDPQAATAIATRGTSPGEVSALTLNTMTIDAVGATLNAKGDMVFDNADKTTLPGFPKPVGDIQISLAGGNGLLDRLVALGVLPEQQAMGARMMLGMFAVPGEAPDTLNSTIEFNAEGQILANGQRIK